MSDVAPGWYPDPVNPLQERLWDGSEWVDKVRPRPPVSSSPAPMPAPSLDPFAASNVIPELHDFAHSVKVSNAKTGAFKKVALSVVATLGLVAVIAISILSVDQASTDTSSLSDSSQDYLMQAEVLLDAIEESESQMYIWAAAADTWFARLEEAYDASPQEAESLMQNPSFQNEITDHAFSAYTNVKGLSTKIQDDIQLSPEFTELVAARNSYLAHSRAWVAYLNDASSDWSLQLDEESHNASSADIEPTFIVFCEKLQLVSDSTYATATTNNIKQRAQAICAETSASDNGTVKYPATPY